MSQSGFIAAMLLAAFILWLAINDRLTTYTNVLFGPTEAPKPSGGTSGASSSGGGIGGTLATAAPYIADAAVVL